jgi:hypothetical protein
VRFTKAFSLVGGVLLASAALLASPLSASAAQLPGASASASASATATASSIAPLGVQKGACPYGSPRTPSGNGANQAISFSGTASCSLAYEAYVRLFRYFAPPLLDPVVKEYWDYTGPSFSAGGQSCDNGGSKSYYTQMGLVHTAGGIDTIQNSARITINGAC